MKYPFNGFRPKELQILAQYVFIYEQSIRPMKQKVEFEKQFISASLFFKQNLTPYIKLKEAEEMRELNPLSKTNENNLYIRKSKLCILLSFCRELRNSICHALIHKKGKWVLIENFYKGKSPCRGTILFSNLRLFIEQTIKFKPAKEY